MSWVRFVPSTERHDLDKPPSFQTATKHLNGAPETLSLPPPLLPQLPALPAQQQWLQPLLPLPPLQLLPPPPSRKDNHTTTVLAFGNMPLGAACEAAARGQIIGQPAEQPVISEPAPVEGFGLKLLESMGWSQGKGLGPDGSGISEPLAASNKHDRLGLGAVKPPPQPPLPPRIKGERRKKLRSALRIDGSAPGQDSEPGRGRRTVAAKASEKVRRKRRKIEQRLKLPGGTLGAWSHEQLEAGSAQILRALQYQGIVGNGRSALTYT